MHHGRAFLTRPLIAMRTHRRTLALVAACAYLGHRAGRNLTQRGTAIPRAQKQ